MPSVHLIAETLTAGVIIALYVLHCIYRERECDREADDRALDIARQLSRVRERSRDLAPGVRARELTADERRGIAERQ